jgi:hypothetical protein
VVKERWYIVWPSALILGYLLAKAGLNVGQVLGGGNPFGSNL